MSRREPLNDLSIRQLPFSDKQYVVWDALPAFGIRVQRRTKTFVLKKQNKYQIIGRWPSVTLKQAREEAYRQIALKYFPPSCPPTATAIAAYLDFQATRVRHGSLIQIRHHLHKHFPRGASLSSLTAATIHDALKDLTPSQQAHAFTLFKAFLNWCVNERQYLHKSPLFGLKSPYRRTSRERTLSDAEIAQILAATTDNGQFNNLVQFLIYSAQRRTQVSKLQRTYCNYAEKTITWPKEDMKSNQQHMIPLTPKLQALIERTDYLCVFGPTPYQAWSRGKAELDRRVKLPHWTLHDLRRTARTNLARLGVQENIAERLLSHTPPKLNTVYNRYHYLPALTDALGRLEQHYNSLEQTG